jgi:outer membrane protein assembly factor BamB
MQLSDCKGVIAFQEPSLLWQNLDSDCDAGSNSPVVSGGVVYQGCTVKQYLQSSGGILAINETTGVPHRFMVQPC